MELWDIKETARNTKSSEAFWRKKIARREIEIIKVGRLVRLDAGVIRAYLAARTRPAKGEEQ